MAPRPAPSHFPILPVEIEVLALVGARIAMAAFLDVAIFPEVNTRYLASVYPPFLLAVAILLTQLPRA